MVALLLLAGIGIILQSEAAYRDLQEQETRVQAEILAASVDRGARFRRSRRRAAKRSTRSGSTARCAASASMTRAAR